MPPTVIKSSSKLSRGIDRLGRQPVTLPQQQAAPLRAPWTPRKVARGVRAGTS